MKLGERVSFLHPPLPAVGPVFRRVNTELEDRVWQEWRTRQLSIVWHTSSRASPLLQELQSQRA